MRRMLSHTFLTGRAVSSVQKQELGRLWQEGQGAELEYCCKTIETEQPRPPLLCAK